MSYLLNPFIYAAAGGGAPVIGYQGHGESTADLTTYTFAASAIGTAAADRRVHVAIGGSGQSRTISSVTVGGVAATQNVALNNPVTVAIYTALVPTGTTADIVVNWSGPQDRCGIGWWSSTGLSSNAALATDSGGNFEGGVGNDLDIDVATAASGFILVYGLHGNTTASGTVTYSPAAIAHRFFSMIDGPGTTGHYGADGATNGTTFDVRTSAVGSLNFSSRIIAASFQFA